MRLSLHLLLFFSVLALVRTQTTAKPLADPPFDPCYNYTVLDDSWRSTKNIHTSFDSYKTMCDSYVHWLGWYRLFINGQSVQMPDTCVDMWSCGTIVPLWLNGTHPTVEDGMVTRGVCGTADNNCCIIQSNPIRVKACPGGYYVYELDQWAYGCYVAYCADLHRECTCIHYI
nr:pancreatic secretory granule membrane major glycoprotein GP2-like [Danio rerio]|eukprot:XP_021335861.1 pancreatic secretory granule membrane major glycoprotein GP2-like [Danio rerio]